MGVARESLAVNRTTKTRMRRKAKAVRGKGGAAAILEKKQPVFWEALSSHEVLGACTSTGSSPVMAALPDCQSLGGLKNLMGSHQSSGA